MKPHVRAVRAAPSFLLALVVGAIFACDGGDPADPGVEPPTPEQLAFQAQPTAVEAGAVIDPPVTVRVLDAAGNLVSSAQTTVVMSIESNPGGASLSGTTSATASGGVATFSDLSLDQAGTGYTLRASASGLTAATSSAFAVTLNPLDQDNDSDGFSPNQGDCDDSDATRNPGEEDWPDAAFVDSNCDGIDGDASQATFVAGSGADAAGCGTMGAPCATVQVGIDEAVAAGTRDVYVMAGTYDDGAVTLADGVSLYGGYGPAWVRDGTDTTRVLGATGVEVVTGASEAVTLVADGITQQTVVADLTIEGPDATGSLPDGGGRSSYAVWVRSSGSVLTLERNTIIGGAGAPGQAGIAGQSAPMLQATSGMNGGPGGAAQQYSTACDDTSRGAGGSPGMNGGSGLNPAGGAGGNGGTMDEDCSGLINALTALNGAPGADAAYAVASFGQGGAGGAGADVCGPGQNGQNGTHTNGAPGAGGTAGGRLAGVLWAARNGGSGGVGQNGSGGGGGGGSGGCDQGIDAYGAGGGGGGAGGLRALSGGGGGGGGGGSFGIYLVDSAPNVLDNTFVIGTGGAGGTGGVGGQGQSGGTGGLGGPGDGGAAAGGRGGNGAHGGHGGGGGGGAGGIAAAIFHSAGFAPTLSGNAFEGGTAGAGGQGGASAPSAPPADDDGNAGLQGTSGTVQNVVTGT